MSCGNCGCEAWQHCYSSPYNCSACDCPRWQEPCAHQKIVPDVTEADGSVVGRCEACGETGFYIRDVPYERFLDMREREPIIVNDCEWHGHVACQDCGAIMALREPHGWCLGHHACDACGARSGCVMDETDAEKAIRLGREAFAAYAAMDAPDLPINAWSREQVRVFRWVGKRWPKDGLMQRALVIAEEASELLEVTQKLSDLAREISIRAGRVARAAVKNDSGTRGYGEMEKVRTDAGGELADVAIALLAMSTHLRLDLGALVKAKLDARGAPEVPKVDIQMALGPANPYDFDVARSVREQLFGEATALATALCARCEHRLSLHDTEGQCCLVVDGKPCERCPKGARFPSTNACTCPRASDGGVVAREPRCPEHGDATLLRPRPGDVFEMLGEIAHRSAERGPVDIVMLDGDGREIYRAKNAKITWKP